MCSIETKPIKLVQYIRDGLVEQEHFGYILRMNKEKILEKFGESNNYPFYLRSCAKPLQASLIIDCGLDKEFNLTEEEIAICSASHAGEKVHTDIIKNLLKKINVSEDFLKCGIHEPLSKTAQKELIKSGNKCSSIHNNCSGKHTMMLALCKLNNWELTNYDNVNHPLQKMIKEKIYNLCEIENEYPITKDGCGVPIFSMSLVNMVKGYLNLFCNKKYEKIKLAFLHQPYIIGGEDRTDTKIIQNSKNIVAKVGAGGLCIIINTELEEGFVVKICDSNMNAREILTMEYINKLNWACLSPNKKIETIHKDIIGQIETLLNKQVFNT